MIYELVAIAGVSTTAVSLVAIIVLGFKLSSSKDETLKSAAKCADLERDGKDMLKERDHWHALSDERGVEIAELTTRLGLAEARANTATTRTRDAIVAHISSAGIGDAVRLGNDILNREWGAP